MKRPHYRRRNPDDVPQWEVRWSRDLFDRLNERGIWGVPRSGLMFQKQGDALVLVEQMPWEDTMPVTAIELRRIQKDDYDAIALRFRAAGIRVRKGERA
jgi:hypothetical protein